MLIAAAWVGLGAAGWCSLWALPMVLLAPLLGYGFDRFGLEGRRGDVTSFGAGVLIVLPISIALILLGASAARLRRAFVRRRRVTGRP